MSDLVQRLSQGDHLVSMSRYKSPEEFKEAIEREFVLVKFTETRGGTEVGFKIDKSKSEIDFDNVDKKLKLVGQFSLDYVPVECIVHVDAESLSGTGVLKALQ